MLAYGIATLGLFSKNKIIITTLATTGPDYEVVFGKYKLKNQLPDTTVAFDVSGIMTTDTGSLTLNNYLNNHYMAFGDYFVTTVKVVGIKQSDSPLFHPLIEIIHWRHIDSILFWLLAIADLLLFILAALFYKYVQKK